MKITSRNKILGAILTFVGLIPASFGLITSGIGTYCISVYPDCNEADSGEQPPPFEDFVQNLKINLGIGLFGIVFVFFGRRLTKKKDH